MQTNVQNDVLYKKLKVNMNYETCKISFNTYTTYPYKNLTNKISKFYHKINTNSDKSVSLKQLPAPTKSLRKFARDPKVS